MTHTILTNADGYIVNIVTNCKEILDYLKRFSAVLNKLTINFDIIDSHENKNTNHIDATLYYDDTNTYELVPSLENNKFYFKCPWEKFNESTLFAMVYRYIVEWLRQSNNEVKVHASSVSINKNTALFIAPSEGGKTTTAMSLCQNYDYKLCANDASVIKLYDKIPIMLRGDCIINARMNGIEVYSTELFQNIKQNNLGSSNPWNQKLNLIPSDMGITVNKGVHNVTHIFFVKLDVLVKETKLTKYIPNNPDIDKNWFKHKMQIFQNIGGTIRGTDFFPSGNGGEILPIVIPSIDDKDLYMKRINFINTLFEQCEIYEIRGKLDSVTHIINNILSTDAI